MRPEAQKFHQNQCLATVLPSKRTAQPRVLAARDPVGRKGEAAEFAIDDAGGLEFAHAGLVQAPRNLGDGGSDGLSARTVDGELGCLRSFGVGPAEDVLATTLGVPEHFVNLCFISWTEPADGKGRGRTALQAPARGGR